MTLSPQAHAALFTVLWVGALIVYERWALATMGSEATISGLVEFIQARFPMFEGICYLAIAGGLLHLFHRGQVIP
jgi:dolichyl-phosphate-mannose--protein O-mannosyl transferase